MKFYALYFRYVPVLMCFLSSQAAASDSCFQMAFNTNEESFNATFMEVQHTPRNYNIPVTQQQWNDIFYVVKTLGEAPNVPSLLLKKVPLEAARKRLNIVHPLNFLKAIFANDRMKAWIHTIRPKSFIWGKFMEGLKDSLNEEAGKSNIRPEFVQDFAASLGLPYPELYPRLEAGKWDEFVDVIIANLPRGGGHTRYDQ